MQHTRRFVFALLRDFGPLIVFVVANHFFGTKLAIAASMTAALAEFGYCKYRKQQLKTFFLFSIISTLIFGGINLYQETPFLVGYEPVITNVMTGLFFLASLFIGKPIIQEFAERAMSEPKPFVGNRLFYVRFLTWVWVGYFFVKAGFYAWVVAIMPFEQALATRAVVGQVSLVALIAGERLFRKQIFMVLALMNLFPDPLTIQQIKSSKFD